MSDGEGCLVTRRGRRLFEFVAICVGWILGITMALVSGFVTWMPLRMMALVLLFVTATATGVRAVNRRDDVVLAAFEKGRAIGPGSDGVTPLR